MNGKTKMRTNSNNLRTASFNRTEEFASNKKIFLSIFLTRFLVAFTLFLIISLKSNHIYSQTIEEWKEDIDMLVNKIETYHPMPWARISQKEFEAKAETLKSIMKKWDNKKITLEITKLVASLQDGHTQVLLKNREDFNKWFPIRIEKFADGFYITAVEKSKAEFLKARVETIGRYDAETTYKMIGEIIASDSEYGKIHRITNYLSNAVVLKSLGVIDNEDKLTLGTICSDGSRKIISLESAEWELSFAWSYNKKEIPTYTDKTTIYDNINQTLPIYLSGFLNSKIHFWYEYLEDDKLLYLQINQFFDGREESLLDFIKRVLSIFDEKATAIKKFVIDVRFNEGGNSEMMKIVDEFKQRNSSLSKGKLFIITGNQTFSAASVFIGQMLKTTNAITVGEIADGPLNMSADPVMFFLPNSKLLVNISRAYSQDGHPTDKGGYYPPDYYIPLRSKDYFSFSDPVLEAIKKEKVQALKDILYSDGVNNFKTEFNRREEEFGPAKTWFPYTSYDLALYVFEHLIPAEKYEEAIYLSDLNTKLYPESIWGWFIQGMIYENMGKLTDALNCFSNLLKIEPLHVEAKWSQEKINAMLYPLKVDEQLFAEYAGDYEGRKIFLENGQLIFESGNSKRALIPISENYFLLDKSSSKVEFVRKNNSIEMIKVSKWNGNTQIYKRIR